MLQNEKDAFILKKTYEISYAIFRVAPYISNASLKERLEAQALALIDAAAMQNYPYVSLAARSIEYLIRFGGDTGIVNLMNAETIIVQINALNIEIAESGNAAIPKEIPLEGIFSEPKVEQKIWEKPQQRKVEVKEEHKHEVKNDDESTYYHPVIKPIPITEEEANAGLTGEPGTGTGGIFKAAMRQSAILERIRQSGNCRLKDIQEILPDASERTIRYDLQSLMEQNLVERIGNGGPAVYYRVRQDAAAG